MHALDYQPCSQGFDLFDTSDLLNRDHPLAQGLAAMFVCLPGRAAGPRWYDLVGNLQGAFTPGAYWYSDGRQRGYGSVFFDGVPNSADGSVDCGATPNLGTVLSGAFTISAWVYMTVDQSGFVVGNGTNSRVLAYNWTTVPDTLYLGQENVSRGTAFTFPFATYGNRWTHLVACNDTTTTTVYANGVFLGSAAFSFTAADPGTFVIGNGGNAGVKQFAGMMDTVMVYGRTLNAVQARGLYQESRTLYPRLLRRVFPSPFQAPPDAPNRFNAAWATPNRFFGRPF